MRVANVSDPVSGGIYNLCNVHYTVVAFLHVVCGILVVVDDWFASLLLVVLHLLHGFGLAPLDTRKSSM